MHPNDPLGRFQALLRFPTISQPDEAALDVAAFEGFAAALPGLYPALHAALEREVVADHSLLYRWRGASDSSPAVLMAHYDVVPATDDGWQHPPFAAVTTGEGAERVLWGRGTLDDKGALVAILEAVERLIASGYTPEHDVYLSFGHNEETAGEGAIAVASLLASRGIRPALVLDEGGAIVDGVFPTVTVPAAVVGLAEKGLVNLLLSVEQPGGHSSTPPRSTATTRLARAVTRLAARQYPARFSPTNLEMIRTLGAHATGPLRMIFRAATVTRPVLQLVFSRLSEETSAMVRTTLAVTRLSGSAAANVLAERATATVNIRVAVGSTVAEAVDHVRRAVRDDAVRLEVLEASEPSPVSPTSGRAWNLLSAAILETHPRVVVTPYIQLGASDSRRFTGISDHVYRFTPFEMSKEERATLHAMNERIHVDTWLRGIDFYATLLRSL
jgi:carboxypeptidase PM20D1